MNNFNLPIQFSDGSLLSLALGFLIAGLIGSWHCALMCGPSACYLAAKNQLKSYHFGRLIGYIILGSSIGTFSEWIMNFSFKHSLWIILLIVIILSFSYFFKNRIAFKLYKNLQFLRKLQSGFAVGLSSALLPCGWLYSFVLASLASRSAVAGSFVMFVFWLTTLPSLSLAQLALKGLIQRSPKNHQKIAQAVLLFASIFSFSLFWASH